MKSLMDTKQTFGYKSGIYYKVFVIRKKSRR